MQEKVVRREAREEIFVGQYLVHGSQKYIISG